MSPFRPRGERARWRIVYDLLKPVAVSEILTYETMADALDLDPVTDRHLLQMAMRRAGDELLVINNRAVLPVRNEGYRVIEAREHQTIARAQQKKSSKALVRSHTAITHVDFSRLDSTTKAAFQMMAIALDAQLTFVRRLDIRSRQLEAAVASIRDSNERTTQLTEKTADEVANLERRLQALESSFAVG